LIPLPCHPLIVRRFPQLGSHWGLLLALRFSVAALCCLCHREQWRACWLRSTKNEFETNSETQGKMRPDETMARRRGACKEVARKYSASAAEGNEAK
jgi:hypothetical protein